MTIEAGSTKTEICRHYLVLARDDMSKAEEELAAARRARRQYVLLGLELGISAVDLCNITNLSMDELASVVGDNH